MGTFSNTFSPTGGSGASDIIPSQGSALVWLDGTIQNISGNYYFVDKKAGRNFLITGYDFSSTWTKGFPYKSAATVSAPAGYTALINADTTSFWYTSGTPNQIPVTSLFQDIDYADRTFCRHVLQATDPITHVEIAEPYVAEIVIYPTAITRSPSIISYFGIPTEQISNVHWVDPNNGNDLWDGTKTRTTGNSGPWKTLSKVDSSGTVGDTCYVKTGTLTALSTSLTKSLTYISVGHAVCKSSTSVASSIALSANIIFTGFELNGVGFTSGTNLGGSIQLLSFGGANSSVNKCIFSNTTPGTRSIYSGSYAGLSINNCVFVQNNNKDCFYTGGLINLIGNYFNYTTTTGSVRCIWGIIGGMISYNRFYKCSTTSNPTSNQSYTLYIAPTNNVINVFNNSFQNYDKITLNLYISLSTSSTQPINITYNSFISQSDSYCIYNESGNTNSGSILTIDHNTISALPASLAISGLISIRNHSNTIISNNTITSSNGSYANIEVYANGNSMTGVQILNNRVNTTSTLGYGVKVGMDDSDVITHITNDYKIDGAIITGNYITGARINNTESGVTMHGYMLGYIKNFTFKYNRADRMGYGMVDEGLTLTGETSVVSYNLITRCLFGIAPSGVNGHKYYNNTIYSDHTTGNFSGIFFGVNPQQSTNYPNTNNDIKNNIVYFNAVSSMSPYLFDIDAYSLSGNTYNNNNCYTLNPNSFAKYNGSLETFVQWQVLGYDTNSTYESDATNLNLTTFIPVVSRNGATLDSAYNTGIDATWNQSNWGISTPTPKTQPATWQMGCFIQ